MKDTIFRMYDVRGIVGVDFMLEDVYEFAKALSYYYHVKGVDVQAVAITMDERSHSLLIKQSLIKGLLESGINVIDCGIAPTPVAYFTERQIDVQASIMITASHNPHDYNGLKLSLATNAICAQDLQELKQYFKERKTYIRRRSATCSFYNAVDVYVYYLANLFPHLKGMFEPVVFDCAYGATAAVVPMLCKLMEWSNALVLGGTLEPYKRTHEADPTVVENMQELATAAAQQEAEFGMGFDGDGDRMAVVFADGQLVLGDKLLAVFAQSLAKEDKKKTVIADAKCSLSLASAVELGGGRVQYTPSGRTFIKRSMDEYGAVLAGELSCHFFFHDRYFGYDDGIYAALRLLEFVKESRSSLKEIFASFPVKENSPELRIPCMYDANQIVAGVKTFFGAYKDILISTIDGVRVQFPYGWGLIRASHTQPVICLRFEADTVQDLERVRQEFVESLVPYFSKDFLDQRVRW